MQGDGAGFPDLVLVRKGRLLFVELKSEIGKVSPQQRKWLDDLDKAAETYVWRPEDWTSGEIDRRLM